VSMTRRSLLCVLPTAAAGWAQRYRDYPRCLPDVLRSLAAEAYARRTVEMRKLATAPAIEFRQKWARATFWKLIGGMPERTPLNIRTTGALQREKYRVEKLIYESRPGEWIAANLYVPKSGTGPRPGVLFQMGHSLNGKAADSYQRCCQGLVQLGFVVLAFDPMGQGERTNYAGPDGLTRLGSADAEHTHPGKQLLLVGDTATRIQTWDAVRSLDVLASHPLVDARRLASAGQSGGATLTMMLAAVDDRLAAAVVASGNTENVACAGFNPPGSVDDAEQNFIGAGPAGFDRWDLLWPFAPRPLLILSSAKDFFGTYSPNYERSGQEEYGRLSAAYRVLGREAHLHRATTPLPHGLSYALRLETYRWLSRWLKNEERTVDFEPPVAPEPDRQLWAGPTGSVIRDFGSETPFHSARRRLPRAPTSATAPPDLRALLSIESAPRQPALRVLSTVASRTGKILAVEVGTAENVWVPAWIFHPGRPVEDLVVAVEPTGRNQRWRDGELWETLAEHAIVCVPDVRGIGDLRPEFGTGAPDYAYEHQQEENYAWASLVLGRSLLGQRVSDLLGVTRAVQSYFPDVKRTLLAARGQLTVPALCAGLLNPAITRLWLSGHLISWRNVVETEMYTAPFANFVPGTLATTDLPEIASAMAPRELVLTGTVDAAGAPLTEARIRECYGSRNVKILTDRDWSRETFLSLLY
jgi:dienelactone hydrolase